jgi:c-di-GMP-binding flagellar brake protein YcgR
MVTLPSERRLYKRYRSIVDAYAVIQADQHVLAQLIDISEGGMAVWYVDGSHIPGPTDQVDLFLMNSPYRISAIPVKTTSDFELSKPAEQLERPIRRRCFQFGNLLNTQRDAVVDFIAHHTEELSI